MPPWKCKDQPCNDCPWRRKSAPGWLGSEQTAEEWITTAHQDHTVECHQDAKHLCAGVAIYRANVRKRLRDPDVPVLPADRKRVFSTPAEFIEHHKKYEPETDRKCRR